ncbi:MAG: sugar transferase [Verrucomicrobia bacterium]|nr:sugar transferase [Verrucomicrobiota bacterium]
MAKSNHLTAISLLALDTLATFVVFNATAWFRGVASAGHWIVEPLVVPVALIIFSIYLIEGYRTGTNFLGVDYTSQHAIALAGATLGTLLLTHAFIPSGFELQSSRIVVIFSFVTLIPLSLSYRRLFHHRALRTRGRRSIVFLGDRTSCLEFADECHRLGMDQGIVFSVVTGTSTPPFGPGDRHPLRLFGEVLEEIETGATAVEAIVLRESAREFSPEISRRLVSLYFDGVPTYTLELFHQVYWRKIPLYRLNQTWLFQEGFQIARDPAFERLKRASDIALAAVGLVLAAPLIAAGALAVWLNDRGPVFFFQQRVGKNHAKFPLVKLRTMRVTPEDGDLYTRRDDPRITRVGNFLRSTRLDELPQLWNVLRGDMSLIGPRAEWDRLVERYEREIPCYYFRHLVKPGITGWAQVSYPYGASTEDTIRKLEYDLYYIRHFSFRLDATIVLKTIHIMLFGKGR